MLLPLSIVISGLGQRGNWVKKDRSKDISGGDRERYL